jgi:hypothetical protein
MINLNEKEIKLVRLAFDVAAHDGEARNASDFLIASLRKRGVTADQFLANGGSNSPGYSSYEALYRRAQAQVSGLQIINASLMKDKRTLEQKIADLSARKATQAQAQASGYQTTGSRGSWQVTSSLLNFTRNPDTRNWYATDKAGCVFCIERTKGRFKLWEKRGYWQTKFSTVGIFNTVAEAVAEAERRMSK